MTTPPTWKPAWEWSADLWTHSAVGHDTIGTIFGVQACVDVRATGVTDLNLCVLTYRDGDDDAYVGNSPYHRLTPDYKQGWDVLEVAQSYGAGQEPWTLDILNATAFGVGLTTQS